MTVSTTVWKNTQISDYIEKDMQNYIGNFIIGTNASIKTASTEGPPSEVEIVIGFPLLAMKGALYSHL